MAAWTSLHGSQWAVSERVSRSHFKEVTYTTALIGPLLKQSYLVEVNEALEMIVASVATLFLIDHVHYSVRVLRVPPVHKMGRIVQGEAPIAYTA